MNKRLKRNSEETEDKELLFITSLLTSIHTEYFSTENNDISQILSKKKNVFAGMTFWTDNSDICRKILSHGGQCTSIQNCNYVVSNVDKTEIYKKHKSVVLSGNYVYESVYNLRKESVEKYVIWDYSGDDEIVNELVMEGVEDEDEVRGVAE